MTHKVGGVRVEEYAYYVNKLRQNVGLETWIRRQIVTSQGAHIKCKWPPYATEWNPPPHENFMRTPLRTSIAFPTLHSGSIRGIISGKILIHSSGVTREGKGGHRPPAQHFGGAKLRSECYELITKCQMSTGANNYNLQNVEYHCEISSRSPRFAKRAIMNLSDVSRRSFCLQQ